MELSQLTSSMDDTDHPTFDFWRTTLKKARKVIAPMVDQSELAWRILCRRHGADLGYSPMYHAPVFVRDIHYRKEALATCPEDRPLIIQFCANDPEILLKAAKHAEPHCDAIDLNLGCPQMIAKRGHYGAFLQEEWELLEKMVSLCARELKVPITCKIRVFDDIEKTVKYAQMLERAGCKLLTVHGRTRDQKGVNTGLASWAHIKAVRENISIPMFANGNILYLPDVKKCMDATGVQGVMSAEGNLYNPCIFEGVHPVSWEIAEEYLMLVEQYPCPLSFIRGHMFKMCHHTLVVHPELRQVLGKAKTIEEMLKFLARLREKSQADVDAYKENDSGTVPYWRCQPYIRRDPNVPKPPKEENENKRPLETGNESENLSKNKIKKLKRHPNKNFDPREIRTFDKCDCGNVKGDKCVWGLCKKCCRVQILDKEEDCIGHHLFCKSTLEKRKKIQTEAQELKQSDKEITTAPT